MAVAREQDEVIVTRSRRLRPKLRRLRDRLLVAAICAGGLVAIVVGVYFAIVLGLGRRPTGDEEALLALSMVGGRSRRARLRDRAGAAQPLRPAARVRRAAAAGRGVACLRGTDDPLVAARRAPAAAGRARCAARSRSPRPRCGRARAALLERAASDPERGPATITLAEAERPVLAARRRCRDPAGFACGSPSCSSGRQESEMRVAPITLLGRAVRAHRRRAGARRCLRRRGRARPRRARAPGRPRSSQRTPRFGAAGVARASSGARPRSCERRAHASWRRPTPSGAGSSGICTTAPSSTRQRSRSTSGSFASSPSTSPAEARRCSTSSRATFRTRSTSCATSRTASIPPLLADRGLGEALRAATRALRDAPGSSVGARRPLPARRRGDRVLLLPRGTAERREARRAAACDRDSCGVGRSEGGLLFEVADDGRGFDPARSAARRRFHEHGRPPRRDRRESADRVGTRPGHEDRGGDPALHAEPWTSAVRVLVVDDQTPFRDAARAVLRATPGFEVVGEAASGEEAVALAGAARARRRPHGRHDGGDRRNRGGAADRRGTSGT